MTAKRAVIDTNVLISGSLRPGGTAAAVTRWFIRYGRLIFSTETFAELGVRGQAQINPARRKIQLSLAPLPFFR